jgi:hypothetical protein
LAWGTRGEGGAAIFEKYPQQTLHLKAPQNNKKLYLLFPFLFLLIQIDYILNQ